jgi:DNA-binding NtrC family response regulator
MRNLPPILIVDDEPNMRSSLEQVLRPDGYTVVAVESAEQALEILAEREIFLMITDARLGGMSGYELLKQSRQRWPAVPVIVITAYATPRLAVEAIHAGAFDYLAKPFAPEELLHLVAKCVERHRLMRENSALRSREQQGFSLDLLIGESPPMRELKQLIQTVAPANATVLILGASATGRPRPTCASTAPRSPKTSSKANCSATRRARSPARSARNPGASRKPTAAPSSWTKSAT